MRIAVVGTGELRDRHLECFKSIQEAEVVALVSDNLDETQAVGEKFGVPFCSTSLNEVCSRGDVDGVVLCTPVHAHAAEAVAALRSGKHVLAQTAIANSLQGVELVAATHRDTRRAVMAGHTHRFSPSHRWIRRRVSAGELQIQHMVVEANFLRPDWACASGESVGRVDDLLWSHAVPAVDLLQYLTGHAIALAHAVEGPYRTNLGVASGLAIQLLTVGDEIGTVSLRFDSDGDSGISFRYVCDNGIFVVRGDNLFDGSGNAIRLDDELCGMELQNREFIAAVAAKRKPATGISDVMDCYRILSAIEEQLAVRRAHA